MEFEEDYIMELKEGIRKNFEGLEIEVLEDIVRNREDEYTNEAYQIALEVLSSKTSVEHVKELLTSPRYDNSKIFIGDGKLKLVERHPDESWKWITSCQVDSEECLESEKVMKYINVLKQYKIPYLSYYDEQIYHSELKLFVPQISFDEVIEILFKENVLLNKEVQEIEELRGVDLDEPIEMDYLYNMNLYGTDEGEEINKTEETDGIDNFEHVSDKVDSVIENDYRGFDNYAPISEDEKRQAEFSIDLFTIVLAIIVVCFVMLVLIPNVGMSLKK